MGSAIWSLDQIMHNALGNHVFVDKSVPFISYLISPIVFDSLPLPLVLRLPSLSSMCSTLLISASTSLLHTWYSLNLTINKISYIFPTYIIQNQWSLQIKDTSKSTPDKFIIFVSFIEFSNTAKTLVVTPFMQKSK